MASAPESVQRFEDEKIFAASPALTARRLREGVASTITLWPASSKGGGQNSPQAEVHHLRNFLLAQGAPLPVDAAAAVLALRDLPRRVAEVFVKEGNAGSQVPFKGAYTSLTQINDKTLAEFLDTLIFYAADPAIRQAMAVTRGFNWTLTLCANPAFALVSQRIGNRIETLNFGRFVFDNQSETQRLVSLPFRAIIIAGELLQNTVERRHQSVITHPETKNADPAPPGPTFLVDQPNRKSKRASDKSDGSTPDLIRARAKTQQSARSKNNVSDT